LTTRLVKTMETPPTEDEFNDSGAGEYVTYSDFMGMYFGHGMSGNRVKSWAPPPTNPWAPPSGDWATSGVTGANDAQIPTEPINLTGLKLTNLRVGVTAHWMDSGEKKTDQIVMEVPGCMKDLLESCGRDTNGDGIIDDWSAIEDVLDGDSTKFCETKKPPMNVYVSQCTGEELEAVYPEEDEQSWCSS